MNNAKWGFGMAPLKPITDLKNKQALREVKKFVIGEDIVDFDTLPENISLVKGLFNRVIKQDQWDWFTVNMYFDYPTYRHMENIVKSLRNLRNALSYNNNALGEESLIVLKKNRFIEYCDNYLTFDIGNDSNREYLYILSRREEKDILKIGMTTRNIQKRVNEINSATGVLYPYSARKVFKVKNCKKVEKEVHELLAQYRIRNDREFFKLSYSDACSFIEQYLTSTHQHYYD